LIYVSFRAPIYHPGVKRTGEVVVCYEDDTLQHVFNELITQGFLGCPVLDNNNKYIHFVDMLDITKAVLAAFGVYTAGHGGENVETREERFISFAKTEAFTKATVKKLLEDFKKDVPPPPAVYRGTSLIHTIEILARENSRRVPFMDGNKIIKGIVTNSMCISLLDQNMYKLASIRTKTVSSMLVGMKDTMVSVKPSDSALDAFKRMIEHDVIGLPVINEDGELINNLSIRDLRILGGSLNHFLRLYLTVATFKQICSDEFKRQTPPKPIFVLPSDTFEDVIRAMDDGNIHRVYVANLNDKGHPVPTHVISQRDVLRFLIYLCGMDPACMEDLRSSKIN